MKFVVDEMPYFMGDCPFYDCEECRLMHGGHCDHFDRPCAERSTEECSCLITHEALHRK
jgi:hypothetical protein